MAGPLAVGATAVQVATAETQEEKVNAGISVTSTGLMLSGNPIAAARGAGLAAGQLIESTLGVSEFAAGHGEQARQALLTLGAGEDASLIGGAIVTVASIPLAINEATVAKTAGFIKSLWE